MRHDMLYRAWTDRGTIMSIKSPSFFVTIFSANLTNLMVLLHQSREWLLRQQRNASTSTALIGETQWHNAHTASRILPNSDISLGSLTSPAPEVGGLMELNLLCIILILRNIVYYRLPPNLYVNTSNRKRWCLEMSRPARLSEGTLQGWMTVGFNTWAKIWAWATEWSPHQDR